MARAPTGLRLRERRRELGLTQAQLAARAEISPSYLNLIENGKRAIGGRLLVRLAQALDADLETFDAAADRRLVDALREAAEDPALRGSGVSPEGAVEFVGRLPEWARAMVGLHRAYQDRDRVAAALADRLNQDPFLNEAVHGMLDNVAAIRSVAEMLVSIEDLPSDRRAQFHHMLAEESGRLADISRALAGFFEQNEAEHASATPAAEVDDFIAERQNYFDDLERAVSDIRAEARIADGRLKSGLIDYLAERFDVRVARADDCAPCGAFGPARYDPDTRELRIPDGAPEPTRRFQIAKLAATLAAGDAIEEAARSRALRSPAARDRARRALASYAAAAALAPYEMFLEAAEAARYDVDALARRFGLSYEQTAHRLTTLRRPSAEGPPFGFMRADPAGFVSKRLALPNLPLPRHGGGCPLWAVYRAFQTPETITRQFVEFPNGERFFIIARAVAKEGQTFDNPRHLVSIMLATDVVHAERLIYSDGIALGARAAPEPVGPSCRLCTRAACAYRQEALVIGAPTQRPAPNGGGRASGASANGRARNGRASHA